MSIFVRAHETDKDKMQLCDMNGNVIEEFGPGRAEDIALLLAHSIESLICFIEERQGEFINRNFWDTISDLKFIHTEYENRLYKEM